MRVKPIRADNFVNGRNAVNYGAAFAQIAHVCVSQNGY